MKTGPRLPATDTRAGRRWCTGGARSFDNGPPPTPRPRGTYPRQSVGSEGAPVGPGLEDLHAAVVDEEQAVVHVGVPGIGVSIAQAEDASAVRLAGDERNVAVTRGDRQGGGRARVAQPGAAVLLRAPAEACTPTVLVQITACSAAAASTSTRASVLAVSPFRSVTTSAAVYTPGTAYVWTGVGPVPVLPSPKFHE